MNLFSSRRKARLLIAAAIAGASMAAIASSANAATLPVGSDAQFLTQLAAAAPGDTLQINANLSPTSPVVITKNLTLQGGALPGRFTIQGGAVADPGGQNDLFRVNAGVTLTVKNLTLASTDGTGSIVDTSGTLALDSSTISGALGSALTVQASGTLSTINSTISSSAIDISSLGGTVNLRSTTVFATGANIAISLAGGTTTLTNSIVQSATGPDCFGGTIPLAGIVDSKFSDATCGAGVVQAPGGSFLLGPLTNNGGSTNTHKPAAGSAALNAGTIAANAPALDQRGAPRSAVPVDIGAYEVTTVLGVTAPPAPAAVEATSPAGAAVTFGSGTATNFETNTSAPATCSAGALVSGSVFPVGTTSVTCSATIAGLSGSASFNVVVQDTTAPVVSVPANITQNSTTGLAIPVTFTATATDLVSGVLIPVCTPASGSNFTVGTTTVTCTATDAAGNVGSASFTVTVVDQSVNTNTAINGTAAVNGTVQATRNITTTVTVSKLVDFGAVTVGNTYTSYNPSGAFVNVLTNNGTGYDLTVSRTKFSTPAAFVAAGGADDIPLGLDATSPTPVNPTIGGIDVIRQGAAGYLPVPTSGSLAVASRGIYTLAAGDTFFTHYQLGPVTFAPAGTTFSTVTYTATPRP